MPAMSSQPDLAPNEQMPTEEPPAPVRKRRRYLRISLIVLVVLVVLGGAGALAGGLYLHSIEKSIVRVDAFQEVPEQSRPVKAVADAQNILLLGSDSRDPDNTQGSRSDTIILAHLAKDRSSAQLISIPRDTWVHVPAAKGGQGNRDAKINAAYAWGGIPLVVQTVESFTGVRVDHVAIIDFAGFQQIVDAVGGVDITVEESFTSIHPPYRHFAEGRQHMDGATALDYSRQRKQFADGDFARIRHQQQVIRAILDKASTGGLLTNPGDLNDFLRSTANAVSVDNTMSIVDMATQLRHLRGGNLTFLTNPSNGTGTVGSESVVFADKTKDKALYDAVNRDAIPEILKAADN
ncbi:LCP family protein [Paractinoplanes globisporus]|uniref:LCP family protein n=2 Tax=Paractinoplanes globisporus TaxID=113565 RepID=A0ABW6WHR5_9ACTN